MATVPASVVIAAGRTTVTVPVVAMSAGSATLTVSLGDVTVVDEVSVTVLSAPSRMLPGQLVNVSISLDAVPSSPRTIDLTSSDPAVIAVPATVTASSSFIQVPITPSATGTTRLTATLGGSTRSLDVIVVSAPSLTSVSVSSTMVVGATPALTVLLDMSAVTDLVVSLTSSDERVLSLPSTVVIEAGRASAQVPVTALETGSTILTAELGSQSRSAPVFVVGEAQLSSISTGGGLQTGAVRSGSISLTAALAEDMEIPLTVSDAAVLRVPPSVLVRAGQAFGQFTMVAEMEGSASVSATVGGVTRAGTVNVVDIPTLSLSAAGGTTVGNHVSLTVSFGNVALAADAVVTLETSNADVLPTPASLVVQAGRSSIVTQVPALSAGTVTLRASWGDQTRESTVVVLP